MDLGIERRTWIGAKKGSICGEGYIGIGINAWADMRALRLDIRIELVSVARNCVLNKSHFGNTRRIQI